MAREAEAGVLRLEAEYRVAGMTPKPRAGASGSDSPRSPIQDRLKYPSRMVDRPGARDSEHVDARECHTCHTVGHIAKFCPTKTNRGQERGVSEEGGRVKRDLGGDEYGNGQGNNGGPRGPMDAHKTPNHKCEHCGHLGHTRAQCWAANPHLRTSSIQVPNPTSKRQRQIAAL